MGYLFFVVVEFVKENMVGFGKIVFLKRNMVFVLSCGFLGDGSYYCACGIIIGIRLFFYGSIINRIFFVLVCYLEKFFIFFLGLGDYKR